MFLLCLNDILVIQVLKIFKDNVFKDEKYNDNGHLINIPYKETSSYIEKVTRAAEIYTELYFENWKTREENIRQWQKRQEANS